MSFCNFSMFSFILTVTERAGTVKGSGNTAHSCTVTELLRKIDQRFTSCAWTESRLYVTKTKIQPLRHRMAFHTRSRWGDYGQICLSNGYTKPDL